MEPAYKCNPEYITDAKGRRKSVILSIHEFEELMEDLHDLAVLAERKDAKKNQQLHTRKL